MFTFIIIIVMALLVSYFIGFLMFGLMANGPIKNELSWENIISSIIIGALVLLFWGLH